MFNDDEICQQEISDGKLSVSNNCSAADSPINFHLWCVEESNICNPFRRWTGDLSDELIDSSPHGRKKKIIHLLFSKSFCLSSLFAFFVIIFDFNCFSNNQIDEVKKPTLELLDQYQLTSITHSVKLSPPSIQLQQVSNQSYKRALSSHSISIL